MSTAEEIAEAAFLAHTAIRAAQAAAEAAVASFDPEAARDAVCAAERAAEQAQRIKAALHARGLA